MSNFAFFLRRWGPALLVMGVIFAFSSVPSNELPHFGLWDFLVEKGGHALGYALLSLTYLRALRAERSEPKASAVEARRAWLMAVLYSVTDEFHQGFVPGRHPSPWDVVIDAIGAAIALSIWLLTQTRSRFPRRRATLRDGQSRSR